MIKLSLKQQSTSKQQKLATCEAECTGKTKAEFVNNFSQTLQELQIDITH